MFTNSLLRGTFFQPAVRASFELLSRTQTAFKGTVSCQQIRLTTRGRRNSDTKTALNPTLSRKMTSACQALCHRLLSGSATWMTLAVIALCQLIAPVAEMLTLNMERNMTLLKFLVITFFTLFFVSLCSGGIYANLKREHRAQ